MPKQRRNERFWLCCNWPIKNQKWHSNFISIQACFDFYYSNKSCWKKYIVESGIRWINFLTNFVFGKGPTPHILLKQGAHLSWVSFLANFQYMWKWTALIGWKWPGTIGIPLLSTRYNNQDSTKKWFGKFIQIKQVIIF